MTKNFYCSAKWEELYLYLNSGLTNSCHHPIPHNIPINELKENVFALHNTSHKMKMQQLLLEGKRPEECHMCWHIEDVSPDIVSDRMLKNQKYKDSLPVEVKIDHIPKFIEVVLDNLCNLSCSYCDSGQSSSWAKELEKNGGFNLKTDYRQLYQKVHLKQNKINEIYLNAWNSWWPEIKHKVRSLKFSGGEPLTSPNVWKTLNAIDSENNLNLIFNSNFSFDKKYIDRLLSQCHKFKSVRIALSLDATGNIAEFARAGLNFELFKSNVEYWCENSNSNCSLSFQSTMNIFNIWGFSDLLNYYTSMIERYPAKIISIYHTVVRFPEFQSILNIPKELRLELSQDIRSKSEQFFNKADNDSINYTNKILMYLESDAEPLNKLNPNELKEDLIIFLKRYETIAKKSIIDLYPKKFLNFLDEIGKHNE